jgi:hypothetical protein
VELIAEANCRRQLCNGACACAIGECAAKRDGTFADDGSSACAGEIG